jgi:hypothetical protein
MPLETGKIYKTQANLNLFSSKDDHGKMISQIKRDSMFAVLEKQTFTYKGSTDYANHVIVVGTGEAGWVFPSKFALMFYFEEVTT